MSTNRLKPMEVVRDNYGFWTHPEIPDFPTSEQWEEFKKKLNILVAHVYLENDAPEHVIDRYFDGETDACKEWTPSKPVGDGWFVLSIHDAENGAVCVWGKNLEAQEQGHESE